MDVNSFPPDAKKLRCLDVFAGCGGLSQDDCNLLLKSAIDCIKVNQPGQKIPQPGEVDLLRGEPPCQVRANFSY